MAAGVGRAGTERRPRVQAADGPSLHIAPSLLRGKPPVVAGASLDRGVPREILRPAADLDLAVLVHPMQLPRPEWSEHYLANLIGNPTETATGVGSVLLGGLIEELLLLRICFVHGGGCAPGLLGRWEHGWRSRVDVRAQSKRPPREGSRQLDFDSVTHDPEQLRLLAAKDSTDLSLLLAERAVDLVDVSSGGLHPTQQISIGPGYQVPFARDVRTKAGIATGAVGLITEPMQAQAILDEGSADVVLLARAALREPAWPLRAAHELGLRTEDAPYPPQYTRAAW